MKILDLSGNEVGRESFCGSTAVIERGNLKAGLYIIHITGDNSGQEFILKQTFR
jgi:hypothetical protein